MVAFKNAIRSSSFVAPSEAEDWIKDVETGNEDPILALIVMRLTKMRKLRFSDYLDEEDHYLLQTLERIMNSSDASIHSGLSIVGAESDDSNQLFNSRTPAFSNLSALELGTCSIKLDVLSRLLRSIKDLKSFSYIRSTRSNFKILHIHTELLKYCQHSLQKLCLQNYQDRRCHIGDITRFQILAELETDLAFLVGSKDELPKKLADVLPKSIERVSLCSMESNAFERVREVVLPMVKSKMECLPNLKALTFDFVECREEEDVAEDASELQEECAKVGVLLTMIDLW